MLWIEKLNDKADTRAEICYKPCYKPDEILRYFAVLLEIKRKKKNPCKRSVYKGSHAEFGIRTQGRFQPSHDFQSCAFDHSANSASRCMGHCNDANYSKKQKNCQ